MTARRGRPLQGLAAILGGWVAIRVLTWQALPLAAPLSPPPPAAPSPARPATWHPPPSAPPSAAPARAAFAIAHPSHPLAVRTAGPVAALPLGEQVPALPDPAVQGQSPPPVEVNRQPVAVPPPATPTGPRWSLDSWVMLRPGGGEAAAALPSYGASQAGAILRYRIATGPHAPQVYLRTAAALAGATNSKADADLAVGVGLRPLRALPLRAQLEVRADRLGGGQVRGRAAVMAVSELPPLALSAGAQAELYAQAGYIAGEAGTGFVDAALRLDRRLVSLGAASLSAGGALSGGAQRGAGRVDLGPAVTIAVERGAGVARAALEWRFRIAGEARPGSGPALTINAGF